jgi:signal transduction histidine kinase
MKIEGLELGADDYVTKPFHPRELMARVRSLVGVRRLQAELADRNARLLQTNDDLATALADLKETESQLVQSERLAAIGELAAGVAHEINNPVNFATNALTTLRAHVDELRVVLDALTGIDWEEPGGREKGLAEVERLRAEVGFEDLVDALGELVTIVTEGLQRSHRLVGDLQSFASPDAGQRSDVDLRRGLESTVQLLRPTARHAGVSIETDFASGLPTLRGDAPALNQVFLNLLKNSAEALDGRGGTICVGTRLEEASIMIEIRDDGPGIAPELLPRLFEPFFTTKEGGRGTGLGLSICQRIVSEHGGTITVESQLGRGTTFRVSLPLETDAGSERDAS